MQACCLPHPAGVPGACVFNVELILRKSKARKKDLNHR